MKKNENLKNMKSATWSMLMHSNDGEEKKPIIGVAEDVVRSWDATTMIVEKNEKIVIFILSLRGGEKAVEVHVRCDEELHMGIVSCYFPIWLKEDVAVKEFFFDMNHTLLNELFLNENHASLRKIFYYNAKDDFRFILSQILDDMRIEVLNLYRPLKLLEIPFGLNEENLKVILLIDMVMNRVTENDDDDEEFFDF